MAGDVLKQLLLRIQASELYALQLDESTGPGTFPGICPLRLWGVNQGRHPLLQTTGNQDNMRGYF